MPGKRVLVIDDNADQVQTLVFLLKEAGHEVEFATNALTGIEAAKRFLPDFVLLDLGLPFMDGFQAARALKTDFAKARLIAITGRGAPDDYQRSLDAGFEAHLVKPIDFTTIEKLLDSPPAGR
jgi:CheY-like chemotaxis protein